MTKPSTPPFAHPLVSVPPKERLGRLELSWTRRHGRDVRSGNYSLVPRTCSTASHLRSARYIDKTDSPDSEVRRQSMRTRESRPNCAKGPATLIRSPIRDSDSLSVKRVGQNAARENGSVSLG